MEFLNVVAAALAAWVFGALWYMVLSTTWMTVSGARPAPKDNPLAAALPFILSAFAMLIVAGMMRHVFGMAGIDTLDKGIVSGLGVGAFFISPWILINNAYPGRPYLLTLIDGGYAIFGCGIIGAVLTYA